MALATAFSVIGASIGFKLSWGPIYWGIISAFIGFILGLGIKLSSLNKSSQNISKRIERQFKITSDFEKRTILKDKITIFYLNTVEHSI